MGKSVFEKPYTTSLNKPHMSVIFAIDASGSMDGLPIRQAEANLNRFAPFVCEDAAAAKSVDMAVVSFNDTVEVIQDWTPISEMTPIHLKARGMTDLSGGVLKAAKMLRERSRVYTECGFIEKKPYLIILSDGADTVTGNVNEAANFLVPRENEGKVKTFFLGVGDYDRTAAAQLTSGAKSLVFEIHDESYDYSEFFDFVANSVKPASQSPDDAKISVDTTIGTKGSKIAAVDLNDWLNDK